MTQLEKIAFNQIRHGDVLLTSQGGAASHGTEQWWSGTAATKQVDRWFTPAGVLLLEMGDTIYRVTKGELRP